MKEDLIIKLSSGTQFKITQHKDWVSQLSKTILKEHMDRLRGVGEGKTKPGTYFKFLKEEATYVIDQFRDAPKFLWAALASDLLSYCVYREWQDLEQEIKKAVEDEGMPNAH